MSVTRRTCALPGCHTLFVPAPRREEQKYCCTAHRKQARARRLEQARNQTTAQAAPPPRRAGAAEGRVQQAQPAVWTPGPDEHWVVPRVQLSPLRARLQYHRMRRLHSRHQLHRLSPPHQSYRATPARRTRNPGRSLTRALAAVPLMLAALVGTLTGGRRVATRVLGSTRDAVLVPAPSAPAQPRTAEADRRSQRPVAGHPERVTTSVPRDHTHERTAGRARSGERSPDGRHKLPMSETLRSAVDSLSNNKLRSVLTMIGIVIGVSAVIMLVALGNGMRTDFDRQFSLLANQITVEPAAKSAQVKGRNLTDKDVEAIRKAEYVQSVSPSMSSVVTLTVGQNQARSNMVGVTHNYLELLDRKIVAGRWFTPAEAAGKDQIAVVGREAVALLAGPDDPEQAIGGKIRINQTNFEIAGVLESDGQNDNVVIVPFETSRAYLVGDLAGKVNQIVVKSTDVSTVGIAAEEVGHILDTTHRVHDPTKRDYNVLTYTNLLNKSSQFINFMSLFIVAIAAVSLLVGGIGVANIMLVSVTERTREIGIRKAIGASSAAIMRQFLSEAVMLTCLGGLVGVAFGIGAALASIQLLPKLVDDFPPPILSVQPVLVAFAVSAVIGVLAGGYPAWRASRMRPIEALRFE